MPNPPRAARVKNKTPDIAIGTCGWSYPHWKGPFYPRQLPASGELAFYAQHFGSVEINNTFYRLPSKRTLITWHDAVPRDFVFAVKASRTITHMKKLMEPAKALRSLFECIEVLGEKLGPVLFQLPPHWHFNAPRLSALLTALPSEFRYAFEFRDHSWINDQSVELLRRHNAAFCIYHLEDYLSPTIVSTDFVYIRLHGPGAPYSGSYDARTLSDWADAITTWARQKHKIYCYFDNDQNGYAAQDAARLRSLLENR